MRQPKQIYCANDNAPLRASRMRKSFKPVNTPKNRTPNTHTPVAVHKRKEVLIWIIPMIAMMGGVFALWQRLALNTLFWPSLIIGMGLFLTTFHSEKDTRLRNVSSLLIVAAFALCLSALLSQNGFVLIGVELALLISSLALVVGWIFKSKPAAMLSAASGLFYLASLYPELGLMTGISDQLSQLGSGLLPGLILGQIILAQKLRSFVVLLVAITASYVWLISLAVDLPLSVLAGLGFAVAAAHYWLGQSWSESGVFGANLHRLCAWLIGLGGALYVQSFWMSADAGTAKPLWSPNLFWWCAIGAAMVTLFVASLMRYKSSHLSLSGIFIIFLAIGSVPIAVAKPDLVYGLFETIPGLNARPGLGLIIGAALIASGLIYLVRGLKHNRILDISMGALLVGIEAVILFQPDSFNADLGVIFVVSLICALCFGGLITGASIETDRRRPNYA